MWSAIVNYALGSRVGRFLSWAAGVAALLFGAFLFGWMKAKTSSQHTEDKKSLENLRKRGSINEEIANMPSTDVRNELTKWVRDE